MKMFKPPYLVGTKCSVDFSFTASKRCDQIKNDDALRKNAPQFVVF